MNAFAIRILLIAINSGLMALVAGAISRQNYDNTRGNNDPVNTRMNRANSDNTPVVDPFAGFDPFKMNNNPATSSLDDPFKALSYKLKVATFNIWGLPIAKDRADRVSAITRYFTKNPRGLDILCLQELWMADDYRTIRAALSLEFPHAHYFKSGVVGSGLAVFSKYPIAEAWWKGYTVTGKAHRIFDGDWYAGKGIGAVKIKHPVIGTIDIFNTHVRKERKRTIYYNLLILYFFHFVVNC